MAYTRDLSTNIGKVRLLLKDRDIDPTNVVWQDDEINTILTLYDTNLRLSAAILLEIECVDQSRGSAIIKLGTFGDDEYSAYKAMKEQAEIYRNTSGGAFAVSDINPIFVRDNRSESIAGNLGGSKW